ncbi:MAG: RluA family pseudouridine synthase [Bacteroidia bacterium]|nr:RluA family pseudouridine synthase [Bacteroidia bacterium]
MEKFSQAFLDDLLPALDVIYEDNHLIAVNKKSGQLVQSDATQDFTLPDLLKHYIKKKYNKPGEVFCGVIHRLDRPVSGVVLFARTSKALERMSAQFKARSIKKTYWAIVKQQPVVYEARLENYLIKDTAKNKSRVTYQVTGATWATLDYKLIAQSDRYYLLQVNPITGRHHQIRVQLSSKGMPIKGDLKYGFDRSNDDGSISLHARMLEFTHPVKQETVRIVAQVPPDALWQFFQTQIESI